MGEIERPLVVFHQAEVDSLHTLCSWIGTIIVGWIKLSPTEASLSIEDGLITTQYDFSNLTRLKARYITAWDCLLNRDLNGHSIIVEKRRSHVWQKQEIREFQTRTKDAR